MKILLCLLLIGLIFITISPHSYFVWKRKDYKTLMLQLVLMGIAMLGGIIIIYNFNIPSFSNIINKISPL